MRFSLWYTAFEISPLTLLLRGRTQIAAGSRTVLGIAGKFVYSLILDKHFVVQARRVWSIKSLVLCVCFDVGAQNGAKKLLGIRSYYSLV